MAPRGKHIGTIRIVTEHPACPTEIYIADDYPLLGRSACVRAGDLVTASQLMAALLEFEFLRSQRRLGNDRVAAKAVTSAWSKLVRLYRYSAELADGDLDEARLEVDGLVLDPNGAWSARRPERLPIYGAAA